MKKIKQNNSEDKDWVNELPIEDFEPDTDEDIKGLVFDDAVE
jgi:hypothetical protein